LPASDPRGDRPGTGTHINTLSRTVIVNSEKAQGVATFLLLDPAGGRHYDSYLVFHTPAGNCTVAAPGVVA
jgi:hypothetical protein